MRIFWFTGLILLVAADSFAQSPCTGKVTDKLNHPKGVEGQVAKPAAGASYVDPTYSTKVTRISDADPQEGDNAVISTLYNSMPGWNSDESMIIAWRRGSGRRYEFYLGDEPYTRLGGIDMPADDTVYNSYPSDIEHISWSSVNPNVLYYPGLSSSQSQTRLMKITLNWPSAPTWSVVRDFATECNAAGVVPMLSLGHGQSISYTAEEVIGLRCGYQEEYLQILYSIRDNVILGSLRSTGQSPPWPFVSGLGAMQSETGRILSRSFVQTGQLILGSYLEHSATGYVAAGGYDEFHLSDFDTPNKTGSLVTYRMDQPSPTGTVIIGPSLGWPYTPSGSHPSVGAWDGSGWVAVGSMGDGYGNYAALHNELYLGNVYTGEVCRVAKLRSREDIDGCKWGYWAESHPQVSHDGYRILFNSDWECSSTVDMYVADLRPSDTTVLTTTLANGIKSEAYSASLIAWGGIGAPYAWTKTVGTWPDGITMSGAGVISGTPTTVETQVVTVQACDGDDPAECDTQELTLKIQERPSISTTSPLADATVGTSYGTDLIATGGVAPRTWSLVGGTMCAGLTLNSDGSIDGTPITLQTCNFTARVTDSHAQPIYKDKAFAITVGLPSACLPGGSSVCMKTFPSSTKILARVGQLGMPSDSSCSASIKQANVPLDTIEVTSGLAKRMMRFTGLDPGTLYTIEASCDGLSDASSQVFTTKTSNTSKNIPIIFRPGDVIPTADRVTVEWGESVVTENTTTNTDCGSGCTVTLSGLLPNIYLLRHTWKNSGGTQLAQSDTRYLVVQ